MSLRIGLGCMRLPAEPDRDDERATATIVAAWDAGITTFDTARAYGREPGQNERLLAAALRGLRAGSFARIFTKGGMTRPDGRWAPDGRARAIRADCEASLEALDGLGVDTYFLHAHDPRTPWRTSVRALAKLVDEGLVRTIGISNVSRTQLDEALDLAPIGAVQVALSIGDDRAIRGGVVERCEERGITIVAHSPLGGPRRARAIARSEALTTIADKHGVTAAEVALAWLLHLSPVVVPIPGARRPETARSAARAASIGLNAEDLSALRPARRPAAPAARTRSDPREVVIVMGIPGAGKTRYTDEYVARGYTRLNRDERGGSLRALADALDAELAAGQASVVLDNTYGTRASRDHVIEAAHAHGIRARCIWLDTPLQQAQVNMVSRLLERFGSLPSPDELRAASKLEEGLLAPTQQMRAARELEPPSDDEGWDEVERVSFVRRTTSAKSGVFVAAAVLATSGWPEALANAEPSAPHLVYEWREGAPTGALGPATNDLRRVVSGPVEAALCPHRGGPPACWCRPPLPGLALAFARAHGVDPARSTLVGCRPAHRTLAEALGSRYIAV
jgi:aryl-alcohol dehydrogenase-like predicted oxidoreductase